MIDDDPIVDGAKVPGIMTAVVNGIVTTSVLGTLTGTDVYGMMTGFVGIYVTTIYYDDGTSGIESGVTNGVVNKIVYDGVGNV